MNRVSLRQDIRPLSEFRSHVAAFIQQVRGNRRPLVITHRGKSAAVLLDVAQYEELLDQLELLQDIQAGERQVESGLGVVHGKARDHVLGSLKK
ncbi:MAG: prevent-host-death family protein [Elusimicrobia bacterium RIFCSPLOWO2_01_FULL_59_12]|nr:MAG: prevent-host-death family protein [Elusimicrobia bacterium RIFCSPLOWO2_01_FULL_59_12]